MLFGDKTLSVFRRKTTLILYGHLVTVDAEDKERIEAAGPWMPMPFDQNTVHWYRNRGTASKPAFELLEAFIMQAGDGQTVSLIDRSSKGALDLRKSNLKTT